MTTTEAEVEHLRADIKKLREDIEKMGATLGRIAVVGAREAGEHASDATEGLRDELTRGAAQLTGRIEKNPLGAALTALGIGLILGLLFAGDRR